MIKNKNFSTADAGWTKRIDQQGHSKEAKGDHVNPVLKSGMCSYKHGICMIGEEGEWAIGQSIIFFNQNIQENFIHKSSFIIARKSRSVIVLTT